MSGFGLEAIAIQQMFHRIYLWADPVFVEELLVWMLMMIELGAVVSPWPLGNGSLEGCGKSLREPGKSEDKGKPPG